MYEKLGLLYLDISDYNNSIANLENALKIYINQKESDDYDRIRSKIDVIYARIKQTVDQENEKKFQKRKEEEDHKDDKQKNEKAFGKPAEVEKIFKVSESLLNKLVPMELYRLSELQLELEQCRSEFAVAYTVGNSEFLKKLSDNRKK